MTQVRDVMTKEAHWLPPTTTIAEAAKFMAEKKIGVVPIGKDDRLVGMVTDRDIVIRGVAEGHDLAMAGVGSVMSERVLYCHDDEDLDAVAANMGEQRVRRLPVVNRDKKLVGMISLGDIAARGSAKSAGIALSGVSGEAEW